MYEPGHAMLAGPLQKHMCPIYIRVGKLVRVAEAEIDMGLRREMEDGVDVMLPQYPLYVRWRCDVTVLEREVWFVVECSGVVQRRAVVKLIKGDDIVLVGVREDEMADEPAGSAHRSVSKVVLIDDASRT
jgi:hypothetical protein